eukprot:jgi/Bigna1/129616/aug1.9_g4324
MRFVQGSQAMQTSGGNFADSAIKCPLAGRIRSYKRLRSVGSALQADGKYNEASECFQEAVHAYIGGLMQLTEENLEKQMLKNSEQLHSIKKSPSKRNASSEISQLPSSSKFTPGVSDQSGKAAGRSMDYHNATAIANNYRHQLQIQRQEQNI